MKPLNSAVRGLNMGKWHGTLALQWTITAAILVMFRQPEVNVQHVRFHFTRMILRCLQTTTQMMLLEHAET